MEKKNEMVQNLLGTIDNKRVRMLECAKTYGINSEVTLKCSKELDELIVKYQKLTLS